MKQLKLTMSEESCVLMNFLWASCFLGWCLSVFPRRDRIWVLPTHCSRRCIHACVHVFLHIQIYYWQYVFGSVWYVWYWGTYACMNSKKEDWPLHALVSQTLPDELQAISHDIKNCGVCQRNLRTESPVGPIRSSKLRELFPSGCTSIASCRGKRKGYIDGVTMKPRNPED